LKLYAHVPPPERNYFPLFHLGWPCGLNYLVEYKRTDIRELQILGLKRSRSFHFLTLGIQLPYKETQTIWERKFSSHQVPGVHVGTTWTSQLQPSSHEWMLAPLGTDLTLHGAELPNWSFSASFLQNHEQIKWYI
jgi:hypothetical protein